MLLKAAQRFSKSGIELIAGHEGVSVDQHQTMHHVAVNDVIWCQCIVKVLVIKFKVNCDQL